MAAETFDNNKNDKGDGKKPTQGVGNAGGKPLRFVLFGVAAVVVLILVTLSVSRRPRNVNDGYSESGAVPVTQYSPAAASGTALGQRAANNTVDKGVSDSVSRPAIAPTAPTGAPEGVAVSGSSSLPGADTAYPPGPRVSPDPAAPNTVANLPGQNYVAPPAPSANRQEETQ